MILATDDIFKKHTSGNAFIPTSCCSTGDCHCSHMSVFCANSTATTPKVRKFENE
jgi:hypothetical protein